MIFNKRKLAPSNRTITRVVLLQFIRKAYAEEQMGKADNFLRCNRVPISLITLIWLASVTTTNGPNTTVGLI